MLPNTAIYYCEYGLDYLGGRVGDVHGKFLGNMLGGSA